jgi:hypothetical protein
MHNHLNRDQAQASTASLLLFIGSDLQLVAGLDRGGERKTEALYRQG